MEQICVTCAARSPEAGSVYELIGELGWRPRWEKGSIRHPATEWLCPTCWQEFKEAAMQGFPSTQRMLAQAKSQEGIPVQRLRSADLFGIVIADSEGRFKQANDAFLRIVGRTREELVSGPDDWKANTPFEWLSGGGSAFAALAADGSLPLHEEVYVGPDGHSVTMLVGGSLLPGTGGDCVGIVVDISERKRVEAELLTVTAFLDSVVENLPHMIFVKDAAELRFQRINKAGEDLLGVQREEMLGKNDFDFFPDEQARFFQAKDRETLAHARQLEVSEEPIQTARGERWLLTKKIAIVDQQGTARHLLGISEDITEKREAANRWRVELERSVAERTIELAQANADLRREVEERMRAEDRLRRTEAQLRQAQRMEAMGKLAGGIAHDFNNILTVILVAAEMGKRCDGGAQALGEILDEIVNAGGRAANLTRQLLAFSRQQVLRSRVLDLGAVVTHTSQILERTLGEHIEIVTFVDDVPTKILADQGQIEQVIINLAVNARDAMPNGGALRIEVRNVDIDAAYVAERPGMSPGPHARLIVSDTGTGMDAATQSRIFEPFFTTKERGEGTGLGLSTVYGVVQQSGGHVSVLSEPGRGTIFTIDFPSVIGAVDAAASSPVRVNTRNACETILLVEDEADVRRMVARVLRADGYQVLEAASAADAIMLIDGYAGTIDLLLSDLVMPKMNGAELAERVRRARPATKIVLMSGYTDSPLSSTEVASGIEFIAKPIMPDVILSKLRGLLVAPS